MQLPSFASAHAKQYLENWKSARIFAGQAHSDAIITDFHASKSFTIMNRKNLSVFLAALLLGCAASARAASEAFDSYLFVYFTGNSQSQEQIFYALSDDGFNYTPINKARPIINSADIALKKAVRDPHILRGDDGWFYMTVTDMKSAEGWLSNRGLVLMRSRDLISWEHHTVNFPERYKGTDFADVELVWAPQTIFDDEAGKYMVYFSLRSKGAKDPIPYHTIYYAYANDDFSDLESVPAKLFDFGESAIDADIVLDGDTYHMFFKGEESGSKYKNHIYQYTFPKSELHNQSAWTFHDKALNTVGAEGSCTFPLIGGGWCLMYDCFGSGYYQFYRSDDLMDFTFVQNTATKGDFTPRHGTVIPITSAEREALLAAFPNDPCDTYFNNPALWKKGAAGETPQYMPGTKNVENYQNKIFPVGEIMSLECEGLPDGAYMMGLFAHGNFTNHGALAGKCPGKEGDSGYTALVINGKSYDLPLHLNSAWPAPADYYAVPVAVSGGKLTISVEALREGANWFTVRVVLFEPMSAAQVVYWQDFNTDALGWGSTTGAQNVQTNTNDTWHAADNSAFYENWNPQPFSGQLACSLNVPNGIYLVNLDVFVNKVAAGSATFFAGDAEKAITEAEKFDTHTLSLEVKDGKLAVGVRLNDKVANWVMVDNCRVVLQIPISVQNIAVDSPEPDSAIYDLTGRKVADTPRGLAPGIYIRSGHKILITE